MVGGGINDLGVVAEARAAFEERDPRPLYMISGMINTKDPKGKPVCQACKEIYEGFILPMRTDDSITDDL